MRLSIVLILFLGACGPVATFYREGAPVTRLNSDQTACEVAALKDAPVANEIRRSPPIFYPPRQVCNSSGACYTRPGYWVEGPIYTVDVNKGLRARVLNSCMAKKGYSLVSLPRCTQSTALQTTARLPPLTSESCVIPGRDGLNQIVSPPLLSQRDD
ncbi:MAG: hypothetical protein AB3N11_09980 [Arenibacterium sp.]